MIFLEGKVYAKVWKVTPSDNGKYIDLQITTSEKNDDGDYINSSWFPRCIGKAVNALKGLERGDRILIKRLKLTNERKEQEDGSFKSYFRFLILDAEKAGSEGADNGSKNDKPKGVEETAAADKEEASDDPW